MTKGIEGLPYEYVGKFKFSWLNSRKKKIQLPKETHHLSRFKTLTVDYELASEEAPDTLLEAVSSDKPLFDGIKIITIHSGYTRNPLDPEEDKKI